MTTAQERQVNNIKNELNRMFDFDKYEFKTWKVDENDYFVSVVFEMGLIGDEGTAAAILGRDRGQIFVGKRGGLKYPVVKMLNNGNCKCYSRELNRNYLNLWTVICSQR